jgi:hypothetical protein
MYVELYTMYDVHRLQYTAKTGAALSASICRPWQHVHKMPCALLCRIRTYCSLLSTVDLPCELAHCSLSTYHFPLRPHDSPFFRIHFIEAHTIRTTYLANTVYLKNLSDQFDGGESLPALGKARFTSAPQWEHEYGFNETSSLATDPCSYDCLERSQSSRPTKTKVVSGEWCISCVQKHIVILVQRARTNDEMQMPKLLPSTLFHHILWWWQSYDTRLAAWFPTCREFQFSCHANRWIGISVGSDDVYGLQNAKQGLTAFILRTTHIQAQLWFSKKTYRVIVKE